MFTDDELIAKLRDCIPKNTAIDAFYETISQAKVEALMQAVSEGNPNAEIFSDVDCSSYVLYLIEKKKIGLWVGMTVYTYCLALMQFSEKQSLRPEHEHYQLRDHQPRVFKLVVDKTLTDEGRRYLSVVQQNYARFPWLSFDKEKVLEAAYNGVAVDAWLIEIDGGLTRALAGVYNLMQAIVRDIFYFVKNDSRFIVPSFTLMNAFHAVQCDVPVQFQPALGLASQARVLACHEADAHILSLYSRLVRDNLLAVHQFDSGPFMVLMHDIAHCFWSNMLTKAQRDLILKNLVHVLLQADHMLGIAMDVRLKKAIDNIVFEWRDFNFSPLSDFPNEDRSEFLMHVLMSAFGRFQGQAGLYAKPSLYENSSSWSEVQDDCLYVLGRLRHSGHIWNELYERNKKTAVDRRDKAVIASIEKAVDQSIPLSQARCGLFAVQQVKSAEALEVKRNTMS